MCMYVYKYTLHARTPHTHAHALAFAEHSIICIIYIRILYIQKNCTRSRFFTSTIRK